METRNFDDQTPLAEPSGTFVLGGREWRVRDKEDVSISLLTAFDVAKGTVQVGPFFRATVHPDDIDEFMALIDDPAGPLTKRKVDDVVSYVTALVMGRPTTPAAGSSPGRKTTGRKSAAGSSSRATPRRRSA